MNSLEALNEHVFVTKLAGFEHTEYIQENETRTKQSDDDIPLVQGKNIRKGNFVEKYDWYIPKKISDNLIRSKLNKKCILIPYVGSNLGEVGIFNNPYECHMASNIAKVELIDDTFDLEYLKYYLQSNIGQKYLFQSKQGSAQPNITMESIRNTMIINRDIKEQRKIGNFLQTIDDKISINEQIINKLEEIVNTIYEYWFVQFEFPNENNKPYCSFGGKLIWNDKIKKNIPENWEIGNLYDIANFTNGLACQNYRPLSNEGSLPVIKIKEMHDGITKETEKVKSNIDDKYIVNNDDILFSWSATLEVMRWYGGIGGLNQHIFKVEPKKYKKNYTYLQLKAYVGNFIKIALSRKTTMGHITSDHIKQSIILLPPESIVEKFEHIISKYYDMILYKSLENNRLNNFKMMILPLLINGQIKIEE